MRNALTFFGVSEPAIYVETSSIVSGEQHQRLVVELPGVTDVSKAVEEIGRTPLLEFKLVDLEALAAQQSISEITGKGKDGEDTRR